MKIEDAFAPLNNPERAASNQVFHTVETFFPLYGKIIKSFSIAWKIWAYFSTENEWSARNMRWLGWRAGIPASVSDGSAHD